jgi:hypothetical protein
MALNILHENIHPRRPNFTDIRTMAIWDPQVVHGYQAAIPTVWRRLNSAGSTVASQAWATVNGATLENGVRIKNTTNTNLWVTCDSAGTSNDMPIRGVAAGTAGFPLAEREELFLEVRQLGHVWITCDAAGATASIVAS